MYILYEESWICVEAYEVVKKARDIKRISTTDVIDALTDRFIELHGDRLAGDDKAVVGGVGYYEDQEPITIIGIEKGKNAKENIYRNFGASGPSGYRKAQRLMKQAEKFNRPVLTLINTAGANASPESEENGINEAIASSLQTMSELTVPTLAIILGEGGSGGAIALALADKVWMMEYSIYSILSPEGFSSILWKDSTKSKEAAKVMKLTSKDLLEMEVVDKVIPETDSCHKPLEKESILLSLVTQVKEEFSQIKKVSVKTRQQKKQERFRKF